MMTFILTLDITPDFYEEYSENNSEYFVGKVTAENYEIACKKVEDKIAKDGVNSLTEFYSYTEYYGYKLSTIDEIVEVEL